MQVHTARLRRLVTRYTRGSSSTRCPAIDGSQFVAARRCMFSALLAVIEYIYTVLQLPICSDISRVPVCHHHHHRRARVLFFRLGIAKWRRLVLFIARVSCTLP